MQKKSKDQDSPYAKPLPFVSTSNRQKKLKKKKKKAQARKVWLLTFLDLFSDLRSIFKKSFRFIFICALQCIATKTHSNLVIDL